MMEKKKKNKRKRDKYEYTDDWCFVCKDGGDLMICDHKNCLKVYHPECVGKDDSLLRTGKSWTCGRHSCFICGKPTKVYCFCCPNAICGSCDSAADFAPICQNGGLCYECFKPIFLAEENLDCDSDGEKIDFNDRDTYECLLKEYWDIVKEKEGLTIDDVYSADTFFKKQKALHHGSSSVEDDAVEEDYELISDSDEDNGQRKKGHRVKKTGVFEFKGSVSKVLTEFLKSIGEDTSKQLTLLEVHSIICKYVHKENLLHPEKKNKFTCDEKLYSIFRRKMFHRNRIYKLLQPHFVESTELSDDAESDDPCEGKASMIGKSKASIQPRMQVKMAGSKKKLDEEGIIHKVRETCYASVNVSNMKLIYLRRSLIEELVEQQASFEAKIVGSLIKVKVDPLDIRQRHQYQLSQVTGVRSTLFTDDVNSQILLQVSGRSTDISISTLSDADIYEEDCEDLRERVNAGLFKRLMVVDVQEKAKSLHEDRTKHWIKKELIRLENLVEQANEKGWRRELYQYLEQRTLLRKSSEVERLLKQEPKVIPETVVETPDNLKIDEERSSGTPPSRIVDCFEMPE